MKQTAHQIKMNKKLLIVIGASLVLLASVSVYATTRITDNQITAQNFNMSGGRFNQEANILTEIGFIKDNSSGGKAHYLDKVKSVYVYDHYAYTVSKDDHSLCIFDVYNPRNITEINCILDDSVGGKAHYLLDPQDIYVNGKYAYVASTTDLAFSVFDISNPMNITEVSYIQGIYAPAFSYSLTVSGKYAYILGQTPDGLSIFDISDPTNITEAGSVLDDSDGGPVHCLDEPRQLILQGKYAYVVSAGDDCFSILDVSNPANITEISYIRDDNQGGNATFLDYITNLYVSGKYAYIVSKKDVSLTIIDISNKSNPIQISSIRDNSVGGQASHLEDPKLIAGSGDYVYVSNFDLNGSLCVFDVSNPYNIQEVQCLFAQQEGESFLGFNQTIKLFLQGNLLYALSKGSDSLSIIEISGVETPSVKTGTLEATLIDVLGNLRILRDVYIGNGLNVAGTGLFSSGLSVMKSLELIGNFTINNHQGISGNYSNGNCWTAYSGGIIYETNCTSA